jgi:ATP-binding cassette, subfamily G (WHITE), member 2, SNQ2
MVNEFHNLELLCVPPQLIPPYGSLTNQGCTLPGAVAGSNVVNGEAYLKAQLNYSYSHLWRNVGIILAFWAFFVLMTLFGMEMILKPGKGGGNVNLYKKGARPISTEQLLRDGAPSDEEAQNVDLVIRKKREHDHPVSYGIAQSRAVFTWSGVWYSIDVTGGNKVLLNDIKGYVKPGRLTALMGGISLNCRAKSRVWSWQDHLVELSRKESFNWSSHWGDFDRWTTITSIISALNRVCGAI